MPEIAKLLVIMARDQRERLGLLMRAAFSTEAGICYTEIDTTADAAKVEEMKRWAGGTWVLPTIVIGQEVGLGFAPEWIQAQLGLEVQGAFTRGTLMPEPRARTRNGIVERLAQAELSSQENDIRKAILKTFAQDGKAPSVREVAQALSLPLEHVLAGFQKLAEYDLIVWKKGGACLLSAYPSSGVSTVHQVLTDAGKPLYAMCAIDALGISFMLGQGASIRSACFFCQQPVRVDMRYGNDSRENGPLLTTGGRPSPEHSATSVERAFFIAVSE